MSGTPQRPEFQFQIIKLNLVASGALIAFALKPPKEFMHTLLIIPLISFTLFSLWVHHAFVIRINAKENFKPLPWSFWEALRRLTFSISILTNFALIPAGAILLYSKDNYIYLKLVDIVLMVLVFLLYIAWFYLQYIKKGRVVPDGQLRGCWKVD